MQENNTAQPAGIPVGQQAQPLPSYEQQVPFAAPAVAPPLDQPWYGIGFGGAIKRFFQKYATFSGRASRSEFWWMYLATAILSIILSIISIIPVAGAIIAGLVCLALLIPNIALSVRRLHDTNLSGWLLALPYGVSVIGSGLLTFAVVKIQSATTNNLDFTTLMGIRKSVDRWVEDWGGYLDIESGSVIPIPQYTVDALHVAAPLMDAGMILLLVTLVISIVFLVLFARKSNPRGARFDKNQL